MTIWGIKKNYGSNNKLLTAVNDGRQQLVCVLVRALIPFRNPFFEFFYCVRIKGLVSASRAGSTTKGGLQCAIKIVVVCSQQNRNKFLVNGHDSPFALPRSKLTDRLLCPISEVQRQKQVVARTKSRIRAVVFDIRRLLQARDCIPFAGKIALRIFQRLGSVCTLQWLPRDPGHCWPQSNT